jgi:hypothetical protein
LAGAHDIHPRDVRVNAGGDVDALHFGPVLGIAEDLLGGNNAGTDDVLPVVDIVQEHVQRLDPLRQATLQHGPFMRRNDARNDVEGDQAFGARIVAVDSERDADTAEAQVGFGTLAGHAVGGLLFKPAAELAVVFARAAGIGHFIEKAWHRRSPWSDD